MNWDSEQVSTQAYRIKELNDKLHQDLEKVQKHLGSMKKVNKLLKDKISEYGITSERVARLVIH